MPSSLTASSTACNCTAVKASAGTLTNTIGVVRHQRERIAGKGVRVAHLDDAFFLLERLRQRLPVAFVALRVRHHQNFAFPLDKYVAHHGVVLLQVVLAPRRFDRSGVLVIARLAQLDGNDEAVLSRLEIHLLVEDDFAVFPQHQPAGSLLE